VSFLPDSSRSQDQQLESLSASVDAAAPAIDEPPNAIAQQEPAAPNRRSRKRSPKQQANGEPRSAAIPLPQKLSRSDKRPRLRFYLLAAADNSCDEIQNLLATLSDPPLEVLRGTPLPDSSTAGNDSPEFAGVVLDGAEQDWFDEIHKLDELSPRPVVLALIRERSSALMRRALRAGADEVLFMPLDPSDVTRALLKVTEARRRSEQTNSAGRICSFISLTGGAGVTTLSGSFALALSYKYGKRVGLVDLNLQSGGLGGFLNLEPENTISLLLDERRAMDSIQLESALTRHDSGLHLLAAPKRVEESEGICEATVTAILEVMRQLFDFVVVDCGSHINENVAAAWERSDQLFYVLDQSIAAARSAVRFMDLFGRLRMEIEPSFILNRFDSRRPVTEELISRTLARPLDGKIAQDDKTMERAQLDGRDPWQAAGGSSFVRNVEGWVQRIAVQAQETDHTGPRRSLFARLFSSMGARA
jgi:pilus assembly protein CpaE